MACISGDDGGEDAGSLFCQWDNAQRQHHRTSAAAPAEAAPSWFDILAEDDEAVLRTQRCKRGAFWLARFVGHYPVLDLQHWDATR